MSPFNKISRDYLRRQWRAEAWLWEYRRQPCRPAHREHPLHRASPRCTGCHISSLAGSVDSHRDWCLRTSMHHVPADAGPALTACIHQKLMYSICIIIITCIHYRYVKQRVFCFPPVCLCLSHYLSLSAQMKNADQKLM